MWNSVAVAAVIAGTVGLPSMASSAPERGEPFPAFTAKDISGNLHASGELRGHPTMVVALTDRSASDEVRAWWRASEQRVRSDVGKITLVSLRLPPGSGGIARGRAREETPPDEWSHTWLDGNEHMAHALGLPNSSHPFVFVLDDRGRVIAAVHGSVDAGDARAVWSALRGR